ncbi:gibberellin 2-beta-dioxygenase 8-like isoform X2 [Salvia splendens]|uniref:gibberellin 2-beta-dioxygenase 8-like isoform X2 n=1 Tax=Salvia splendens TaxID=180675 RepID=UPI001C26E8FE|nr:gibberellin 2-beta-dioxygenase 8-like isoform X2 [Salvia splendens]
MVASENDSKHANQAMRMHESADPPFETTYKRLLEKVMAAPEVSGVAECELPMIDLNELKMGELSKRECKKKMAQASQEWGFFQVVNHGICKDVLEKMREEQVKLFAKPFSDKAAYKGSYRWGTPSATCLAQLSWSEAFHVSVSDLLSSLNFHPNLSSIMRQYARMVSELSQKLVEILASELGQKSDFFKEKCVESTCYLRLNRYPACPISPDMFGIMAHTDSDFITVLHQDQIGGLQLVKDGSWFAVKPNPQALVINIGDLFQAWSNNVYKSVEHRVVANPVYERFSTAYFFCPSYDTVIASGVEPCVYKSFTFVEYRKQVQQDVKFFGHKIGLPRFLLQTH